MNNSGESHEFLIKATGGAKNIKISPIYENFERGEGPIDELKKLAGYEIKCFVCPDAKFYTR